MALSEKKYDRMAYIMVWMPLIVAPCLYMFLAYFAEKSFTHRDVIKYINFMLPFLILFGIHDLVLIRGLFLKDRIKTYVACAVVLLGLFGVYTFYSNPPKADIPPKHKHEFHEHPGPGRDRGMHGAEMELDDIRHRGHKPPEVKAHGNFKGVDPLAMDIVIALLLMGYDLSVAYFIRYSRQRKRDAELENERLQQELEYLKAQLNPHFFMNMLNNIHGMVEINPPKAQDMIMMLSKLMRYVLYEGTREYTSLRNETEFLCTYVDIMRKRYSEKKVSITLEIPKLYGNDIYADDIKIPPLMFIVIVENAFKHGISYHRHSSFYISLTIKDNNIEFVCRNNLVNAGADSNREKENSGIGLANLRKRLALLYGNEYEFKITADNDTYTAVLKIPYVYETVKMYSR